jgi:hypothetical protein
VNLPVTASQVARITDVFRGKPETKKNRERKKRLIGNDSNEGTIKKKPYWKKKKRGLMEKRKERWKLNKNKTDICRKETGDTVSKNKERSHKKDALSNRKEPLE